MFDFVLRFFSTDDFMPHGMCYLWRPDMIAMHVVADAVIALAYFTIPFFLYSFARKKAGTGHIWVLHLFASFILLCGVTHLMGIWVLWNPDYAVQGLLKLATAVISAATAFLVWRLMPTLLALPTTDELADANERLNIFKRVLDAVRSGVIISQTQARGGDIIYCNPTYEQMMGFDATEIIGADIEQHTDQLFNKFELQALHKGLADHTSAATTVITTPPSTDSFLNEISIAPVADDAGEISHWVSFNTDVTEREKAADAVKENEELFRAAFESTPQGIALLTIDGRWIRVNHALCHMLGYTNKELRALDFAAITRADDLEIDSDRLQQLLSGKIDNYQIEKRYIRKDGSEFPALLSVGLARDKDGKPQRFVAQMFDLSDIKQAQLAVKQGERLYQAIQRNSDIAIFVEDMSETFTYFAELRSQGVTDLIPFMQENPEAAKRIGEGIQLKDVNDAGLRLLGANTVQEVFEFGFFKRPETRGSVAALLVSLFELQPTARGEATFLTIDGREISVVYSLPVPHTKEEAVYVPLLVVEVSELRKAQKAESANKAKSEFLATMSHEIRSPLNAIIGNIELIAMNELDLEVSGLVNEAGMASKSLLALVGNILDFSKIEAGALTFEDREMDPVSPLTEAIDIVMGQARQKNIHLTYTIDPDLPQAGIGDQTRLRQILLNLISNAVKFTDGGGIWASVSIAGWHDKTCMLRFDVIDSGKGFSEDVKATLFQPFAQDKSGTTNEEEGTGLGLTIAKSIVERLGGEIGCTASPGEGAHFWFTWPMDVTAPAQPPVQADLAGILVDVLNNANLPDIVSYFEDRGASVRLLNHDNAASSSALPDIRVALFKDEHDLEPLPEETRHSTLAVAVTAQRSINTIQKALKLGYVFTGDHTTFETHLDSNLTRLLRFESQSAATDQSATDVSKGDFNALEGKHILVLEDRPANQMVIRRQLTKLGMSCTIAENGKTGLKVLKSSRDFAAILCDCAMPVMDGFAFTEELRRREKQDGLTPLSVIALTANAFRDDVERCIAAGMNDFVSKPVSLANLSTTLSRWVADGADATPTSEIMADEAEGVGPIDFTLIAEMLGTDEKEAIAEIVEQLAKSAPEGFVAVSNAANAGDGAALLAAAHASKGEARNCGASALGDLYEAMESNAKTGKLGDLDLRLAQIKVEIDRVVAAAAEYVA